MASYYPTILLSQDAPLEKALEALVKDDMTRDWSVLYVEFHDQRYPPIPCLNRDLKGKRHEPEPEELFTVSSTLAGCRQNSVDSWGAADCLKCSLLKWKIALEKHFGAIVSDEPFQDYPTCLQDCLHDFQLTLSTLGDEETRADNKKKSEKHLRACEKAARRVMLRVVDALQIIPKLQARYLDIQIWATKAMEAGHKIMAPQSLRVLLLEVNEWLRVVMGALRGYLDQWQVATENHQTFKQGYELDPKCLDTVREQWDARSKKNQQKNMDYLDELHPLDEQEMWAISMRQQMNNMSGQKNGSEDCGKTRSEADL